LRKETPTDWQEGLIDEVTGRLPPFICGGCYQAHMRAKQAKTQARQKQAKRQRDYRARRRQQAVNDANEAKRSAAIARQLNLEAIHDRETTKKEFRALLRKFRALQTRLDVLEEASVVVRFLSPVVWCQCFCETSAAAPPTDSLLAEIWSHTAWRKTSSVRYKSLPEV